MIREHVLSRIKPYHGHGFAYFFSGNPSTSQHQHQFASLNHHPTPNGFEMRPSQSTSCISGLSSTQLSAISPTPNGVRSDSEHDDDLPVVRLSPILARFHLISKTKIYSSLREGWGDILALRVSEFHCQSLISGW